jgi:ubiquinone/menaquinone biosynthesis C-methylase UbiE
MSDYYNGWRAQYYNFFWHTYTKRTLKSAEAMIDLAALFAVPERLGRHPRVLDVACGTGILLKWLLEQVPELDAYGVDASADMLAQASAALKGCSHVHLERMELGSVGTAGLPYGPGTFDLITFTNALHYLPDPVATLAGLGQLLAPAGQLVLEDYRERELWLILKVFRWLVRWVDPRHVRTYTLVEANSLCRQAGLSVVCEKTFAVDWLCNGWALQASPATTGNI